MNGKQLKNSILQWAIQGKLVPQDPNDEPASVLLERIRDEKARLVKEKKIKKDKNESIIFRGDDNSHYEKFADGTVKCIDDEIPFEIPQSWCWVRFGNLVIHNPQATADDEANAAFMPMTLIDTGYGSSYTYETKKWGTIKTGFTKIATGDIAYAKITPCFQNRKSFILGEVPGGVAAATTELNVIRTYAGTLDGWYILYFLKSEYFIKEARYKGTAGQQRVLSDYVQNKLVPLPPLNEQKRIVQKIQEALPIVRIYGKSQEALDKLNADIFDKLKKSVLQEAIQGKLVPQSPNDEPASVLLERIKGEKAKLFKEGKLKKKDLVDSVIFKGEDNKYYEKVGSQVTCIDDDIPFDIPSSWSWIRLGNYTEVIGGYAFQSQDIKSENGCRVIRISDISEKGLVNTRKAHYNGELDLSQYRIYNNDILMAMTGGTVGKSLLLKSDDNEVLLLNQRVAIIRNRWFDVNYIDTVIKSAYIKSIIDNSKNSTNDNISMADITGFIIPIPPLNEQRRIINKLEFVIASIMRR